LRLQSSDFSPVIPDLLTAIQLTCVVLLAIGGPIYGVLRLKWRAAAAEYMLRNERLKSSRLEHEVEQLRQALAEAQHSNREPEEIDPESHRPVENAEGKSQPPTAARPIPNRLHLCYDTCVLSLLNAREGEMAVLLHTSVPMSSLGAQQGQRRSSGDVSSSRQRPARSIVRSCSRRKVER
jgi:hypothetical protein